MRIFIIGLFILYSFTSGKPTNPSSVGIAAGSHGWGISYKRILKSKPDSELNFEIRFYDVKGEAEFFIFDRFGNVNTYNEKSLVLIPAFGGWKYFPFAGKIENNFSPFLTLKAGLLFIFDGDEDISSFFERWKKAQTFVTFGGYVGVGIKFLASNVSSIAVSAGLDILPMNGIIDDRSHYNGLIIQIDFSWRK